MKPYFVNFLNALVYILLGIWAYFSSEAPSPTALIPVFAGVILLAITPGFKNGNRVLAHVAVGLTFLMLFALIKPLTGALGREDQLGAIRVVLMMISSLIVLVVFVKSFIDVRRSQENNF